MLGLFWVVVFVGPVIARGPHHPRGSGVAKHHVHYRPTRDASSKLTEDGELLHDTIHLQEHLEEIIDEPDLSKMSEDELEFYYFQSHDSDKNSKLDGLELLQAILHTVTHHDEDEEEGKGQPTEDEFEYYIEMIDRVLSEDDLNNDGYLNYAEYKSSRNKSKNVEDTNPSVTLIR